ncbi:hypothetical protein B0O99DRAFT_688695 [Bisporella sp. PMI_857]|nr:hypothetical protein B0O99DRAFT_688695 [Bisporella sp. PMI_857]
MEINTMLLALAIGILHFAFFGLAAPVTITKPVYTLFGIAITGTPPKPGFRGGRGASNIPSLPKIVPHGGAGSVSIHVPGVPLPPKPAARDNLPTDPQVTAPVNAPAGGITDVGKKSGEAAGIHLMNIILTVIFNPKSGQKGASASPTTVNIAHN